MRPDAGWASRRPSESPRPAAAGPPAPGLNGGAGFGAKPSRAVAPARHGAAAFLVVVAGLCAVSTAAQAQRLTSFVSNTGATEEPFIVDGIQAQNFQTGANADGYTISDVRIQLGNATGARTRVRIRENNTSSRPGELVAQLTNPGTLTSNRLNRFTAPADTRHDPETTYWITVSEGIPRSSRVTLPKTADLDQPGATTLWRIGNTRLSKVTDSGGWNNATTPLLVEVRGTTSSTDATLSALALADDNRAAISLNRSFATATASYTASVANSVSRITVTETRNDAYAAVDYLDGADNALTDLNAGRLGHQLDLRLTFAAGSAPATGKPSIRGTAGKAWVGGTLRVVTTDITDEDGLSGATYGYQWVRVDADGMSNATDITSETSDTYVPVEADVGKKVRVKVSFTDDGGGNEELTSDAYPSSGTIEAEAPGICERTT